MFFEINSHSDFVKNNLLVGAIVLAGMWAFNGPIKHDAPDQINTNGQKEIVVKAGNYQTHYTLGKNIEEPFLVTTILPQRHRDNPFNDYHSEFVTFTPAATRKYMKKYAGMTHCPANFLNRHADHISLYAANPEIADMLSRLKQPNGSHVSRWQVINITGQCIGKRSKIEKNGEDVTDSTMHITLGRKASRDCHMIYVTGLEKTNMPVHDYMRG